MRSDPKTRSSRLGQVAVDFLSSYGIAILIMLIAIAIAYQVSTSATYAFSSQCTPQPGFSCGYYSINGNGILTIGLAQATGAAITVEGVACSTQPAQNGLPAYGNLYVTRAPQYYPYPYSPGLGVTIPSSGQVNFNVYCYGPTGIVQSTIAGSSFAGYVWVNYTIQNTNIHSVQQVASLGLKTIFNGIFSITPVPVAFTENAAPSNEGTVSPGSGIYLAGNTISISETPNAGYAFTSWTCSGSDCYSGTNPSPNLMIISNTIETANFESIGYSFTESASPSDGGTVSPGSGIYLAGNTISISETPSTGYSFSGWSGTGSGSYTGASSSNIITINGIISETADFTPNTYSFTESASPSGDGTVSPGSGTYNYGSSISISASPNSGYTLTGWSCSGNNCYSGSSSSATVSPVTSAVTETADFAASCSGGGVTYSTPGSDSVTIPTGCNHATVQLYGGGGGGGGAEVEGAGVGDGGTGGAGDYITGTASVTPGATLYVWVGGGGAGGDADVGGNPAGGTNNGGEGGSDSGFGGGGGGGGGCSAVSSSSSISSSFIFASGGGGGGGNGAGINTNAPSGTSGTGGGSGSFSAGGNGGNNDGGNGGGGGGGGGCGSPGGAGGSGGGSSAGQGNGGTGGSGWASSSLTSVSNPPGGGGSAGSGGASSGGGTGGSGKVIVTWSS